MWATRWPACPTCGSRTPLGADPDLGREVLKVLVTGQATKAALTRVEMEGRPEETGLLRCDDRRDMALLRSFEREGAAYYELTHDTLAKEVAIWIGEEEMGTKLARELENWRGLEELIEPASFRSTPPLATISSMASRPQPER